jgi:hypothetical protein
MAGITKFASKDAPQFKWLINFDKATRSYCVWALVLTSLMIACGTYSVRQGIDIMWDLKNYHFYNPFAAYHDRYMLDVAPAQLQSYYNPLMDFPFYTAVQLFNDRPRLIAFLMGTVQGLNLLAVTLLAWCCLASIGVGSTLTRLGLTLVALAIGATGAGSAPLIGSTTGDLMAAVPVLIGLYFLVRGSDVAAVSPENAFRDLIFAGGLGGLAVGSKLTMGPYGIAMAAALIVLPRRIFVQGLMRFLSAGAAGWLLTGGYHHLRMLLLFGNPLFPMMNNVFQSPYWEHAATLDTRFLPKTAFDAIFYPFEWATYAGHGIVSEMPFRDIRIALSISLGILVMASWGLSYLAKKRIGSTVPPSIRALVIFGLVAYSIWLPIFSIYRYLLPLEMLSGLFIVLALGALTIRTAWVPTALGAAVACIVTTVPLEWGHVPFGKKYLEISAPVLPPDTLVTMIDGDGVSYLIPFLDRHTTWISLNNNFLKLGQHNLLVQRERNLISTHEGPIMVLWAGTSTPAVLSGVLAAFDLAADEGGCELVHSNIPSAGYQLCPVRRVIHSQ